MKHIIIFLVVFLAWQSVSNHSDAQIRIVSPSEFAESEANSSLAADCCASPFRVQHVFLAEDFLTLPDGGAWLIGLALRPDGNVVTGPQTKLLSETVMTFSTTDSGVDANLSRTFSENRGSDLTTVKTGDFTLSTENLGPDGGPKLFDYIVEFDEPFFYNPDDGNLLWEWSGRSEASLQHDFVSNRSNNMVFGGANDANGAYFGSSIVEFTFVPEPTFGLEYLSLAAGVTGLLRRRRS